MGEVGENKRAVSRTEVDLEVVCKVDARGLQNTLGLVLDLSPRGARIALWEVPDLEVGDRISLLLPPDTCCAIVRRVLPGSEYGVSFEGLTTALRARLIRTVGSNRVSPSGWATPAS